MQPAHTVGVFFRYHTRVWNRNSLSVSAPTGQRSTTLPEYGLSRRLPGKIPIWLRSPRSKNHSSPVFVTSSQKRMQRLHWMQRSWSSMTCSPMSIAFERASLVSV